MHDRTHRCKHARPHRCRQRTHHTHTCAHARVYATHECTQMRTQVRACVRACVRPGRGWCDGVAHAARPRPLPSPPRLGRAVVRSCSGRSAPRAQPRVGRHVAVRRFLPAAPFCALSRTCASHLCARGHARSTPTRARGSPGQQRRRTRTRARPSVAGECSTRARPAAGAQPMRASCRSC